MPNRPLKRLLLAQKGRCFFCQKKLQDTDASVEHLVASSKGGSNRDDNCVACCKSLNILLGSKPLKEKIRVVLNRKGKCPTRPQKKITKTVPPAPPKATKLPPQSYTQVVANLNKRGNAKPGTVPALKNCIVTSFPKLSLDQADVLVQQLRSRRVILTDGSKVIYAQVIN